MLKNKTYKNHMGCVLAELELLKYNVKLLTKQSIRDDIQNIINNMNIRAERIL